MYRKNVAFFVHCRHLLAITVYKRRAEAVKKRLGKASLTLKKRDKKAKFD
jgi:hypothetical protein